MALTDPQDCLAYHQSRALTSHRDMSAVSCKKVVAAKKAFEKADLTPKITPETVAMRFYAMNHGMALLSAKRHAYEKLTDAELAFVNDYHQIAGEAAARSFYYLLEICTREARHNSSLKNATKDTHKAKLTSLFGPAIAGVHASTGSGEESIMKSFFDATPDVGIGDYCKSLQWVYYHSKWPSSYGGPAWGGIADCLHRFVSGEHTAEMMLDTVWTLEHNTAAIFNKPTKLFAHNGSYLRRILDVQRSGQVVELVLHDKAVASLVDQFTKDLATRIKAMFPDKIGEYVDWYKVEALGAIGSYHGDKQQQIKLHALTPEQKAALAQAEALKKAKIEAAEKAAKLLAEKKAAEAAEKMKNQFVVMPGVVVEKVTIPRAA